MNAITIRPNIGKNASQSFESRLEQREASKQALRLTAREREELEFLWRGYASELGCKSLHGATQDRLLRAPPKAGRRTEVLAELERAGGRAPEGAILRILMSEGFAKYEIREAIRRLIAAGKVERAPVDLAPDRLVHGVKEQSTGHELRLATPAPMRLALVSAPLSAEDRRRCRWRAQDDALEAWHHTLVCVDSPSAPVIVELTESKLRRMVPAVLAALRACSPRHALVLRRVYGDPDPSARYTVFGRELAALASLTKAVERRRAEAQGVARHTVSAHEIVREALDGAPEGKDAKARWAIARASFVATVKAQCEQLLIAASAEYRKARRGA